jgi:hypothetical protein
VARIVDEDASGVTVRGAKMLGILVGERDVDFMAPSRRIA